MYICKRCGKRTLDKSQMRRHMILYHECLSVDIGLMDLMTTEEVTSSHHEESPFDSSGGSSGGGGASGSWDSSD